MELVEKVSHRGGGMGVEEMVRMGREAAERAVEMEERLRQIEVKR